MGRQVKKNTVAYKQWKAAQPNPAEVEAKKVADRERFYASNPWAVDTQKKRLDKTEGLKSGGYYN